MTLTFQFLDVVGGCADNYLHLSELTFYMDKDSADSQLNPVYCDSISSFGDSPTNEQIEKAHDGDVATKWLDKKMRGCNPCEVAIFYFSKYKLAPRKAIQTCSENSQRFLLMAATVWSRDVSKTGQMRETARRGLASCEF